jgi:hypothetical protein
VVEGKLKMQKRLSPMVIAMKKKSSMPDPNDGSHQGTFIMKGIGLQTFQCCASDNFLKKMKDKANNSRK